MKPGPSLLTDEHGRAWTVVDQYNVTTESSADTPTTITVLVAIRRTEP